jgi:serine/threonine protein kinase
VLPEELSTDKGFIQRFEKEIAALASVEHPHIVKVHNASFADGQHFLVSDYIADPFGESLNLSQYLELKEGKLNEEEVFKIVSQIASAIDHAHQQQVNNQPLAHRGIKLTNILIKKENLQAYLSDFGLSRIIGQHLVLAQTYKVLIDALGLNTVFGAEKYPASTIKVSKLSKLQQSFLQNYAFLAPEQKIIGDARQVDAKADIYAFGVLVYYLLMGQFPEGYFF